MIVLLIQEDFGEGRTVGAGLPIGEFLAMTGLATVQHADDVETLDADLLRNVAADVLHHAAGIR